MDTTSRAGTPRRQRKIEDMRMRKLEPRTQEGHIRADPAGARQQIARGNRLFC